MDPRGADGLAKLDTIDHPPLAQWLDDFEQAKQRRVRHYGRPIDGPPPFPERHRPPIVTQPPTSRSSGESPPPPSVFDGHAERPGALAMALSPSPLLAPLSGSLSSVSTAVAVTVPCEFAAYADCQRTFPVRDVDALVEHVGADHLGGVFPPRTVCWFCDGAKFEADEASRRRPQQPQQPPQHNSRAAYHRRMLHIAGHFLDGTADAMRPDFDMLDHLRDHGLIDTALFQHATRYSELESLGLNPPEPGSVVSEPSSCHGNQPRDKVDEEPPVVLTRSIRTSRGCRTVMTRL